jgi:hypothetical protein
MLVDASVPQLLSDLLGDTRTEDEYEQVIQWSIHLSVLHILSHVSFRRGSLDPFESTQVYQNQGIQIHGRSYTRGYSHI